MGTVQIKPRRGAIGWCFQPARRVITWLTPIATPTRLQLDALASDVILGTLRALLDVGCRVKWPGPAVGLKVGM